MTLANDSMPIDSIPNAPMDLQALKYIEYEIVIKKIENEDAYIFLPSEDFKEKVKHLYETYAEKQQRCRKYAKHEKYVEQS